MFTGLVEEMGTVVELISAPPGVRLVVNAGSVATGAKVGDSVALNGCCLTVVRVEGRELTFEAGAETLGRTNLGQLGSGSRLNLERSLRVGDRLGGHFVSGHIDATGVLDRRLDDANWSTFWFRVPPHLSRQMAAKGSVAVDGVSLTLVEVTPGAFSVALIPHTLQVTTLGSLQPGGSVNIETDLLAKYVEQQLQGGRPAAS